MNAHVLDVCSRIMKEVNDSNVKHGDWSDYSNEQMLTALSDEFIELWKAGLVCDVNGQHGMIREAIQLANCCVKLVMQLEVQHAG